MAGPPTPPPGTGRRAAVAVLPGTRLNIAAGPFELTRCPAR